MAAPLSVATCGTTFVEFLTRLSDWMYETPVDLQAIQPLYDLECFLIDYGRESCVPSSITLSDSASAEQKNIPPEEKAYLSVLDMRIYSMFTFLVQSIGQLLFLVNSPEHDESRYDDFQAVVLDCARRSMVDWGHDTWVSPFELMAQENRKRGDFGAEVVPGDYFSTFEFVSWYHTLVRARTVLRMMSVMREMIRGDAVLLGFGQ
ncbi:hypothetical protein EJ07DRAFT_160058 [Lizonia empirigonia]|nr:hypothetical protein EJ07DRAFT_160058 [Lizonia empirigonia]